MVNEQKVKRHYKHKAIDAVFTYIELPNVLNKFRSEQIINDRNELYVIKLWGNHNILTKFNPNKFNTMTYKFYKHKQLLSTFLKMIIYILV